MMTDIRDINNTLQNIIADMSFESYYSTTDALCDDFEKARQKGYEAKERHEQEIKKLVKQLNEFLNYPVEKWFIFKTQDKVSYKNHLMLHGEFQGYDIKILFIDNQQYYCVIKMLEDNKRVLNVGVGMYQKYWIMK